MFRVNQFLFMLVLLCLFVFLLLPLGHDALQGALQDHAGSHTFYRTVVLVLLEDLTLGELFQMDVP